MQEIWSVLADPYIGILICKILIFFTFLKSVTIGSDFNFHHWFKYKKIYSHWYFNRPTFEDYLKQTNLEDLNG